MGRSLRLVGAILLLTVAAACGGGASDGGDGQDARQGTEDAVPVGDEDADLELQLLAMLLSEDDLPEGWEQSELWTWLNSDERAEEGCGSQTDDVEGIEDAPWALVQLRDEVTLRQNLVLAPEGSGADLFEAYRAEIEACDGEEEDLVGEQATYSIDDLSVGELGDDTFAYRFGTVPVDARGEESGYVGVVFRHGDTVSSVQVLGNDSASSVGLLETYASVAADKVADPPVGPDDFEVEREILAALFDEEDVEDSWVFNNGWTWLNDDGYVGVSRGCDLQLQDVVDDVESAPWGYVVLGTSDEGIFQRLDLAPEGRGPAAFAALRAGIEACDGVVDTEGEEPTLAVDDLSIPEVGEESFGFRIRYLFDRPAPDSERSHISAAVFRHEDTIVTVGAWGGDQGDPAEVTLERLETYLPLAADKLG